MNDVAHFCFFHVIKPCDDNSIKAKINADSRLTVKNLMKLKTKLTNKKKSEWNRLYVFHYHSNHLLAH